MKRLLSLMLTLLLTAGRLTRSASAGDPGLGPPWDGPGYGQGLLVRARGGDGIKERSPRDSQYDQ